MARNPISTDYTTLITSHYNADEGGVGTLVDAAAAGADWTDIASNVANQSDGLINSARGPCSGASPGFTLTNANSGPYDFRGATSMTFIVWFRMDSITGVDNIIWEVNEASSSTKALLFRAHHRFSPPGANPSGPAFFMSNNSGSFAFGLAPLGGGRTMVASAVWMMAGIAYDAVANLMGAFWGDETGAEHYDTVAGNPTGWQYTVASVMGLGRTNGVSSGQAGLSGDLDHIDWYNGIAFDEPEFSHFFNSGNGRAFPGGYTGIELPTDTTLGPLKASAQYKERSGG